LGKVGWVDIGVPISLGGFIVDPAAGQAELDERKEHDDQEQNPCDGGCIPHAEKFETEGVKIEHGEKSGIHGPHSVMTSAVVKTWKLLMRPMINKRRGQGTKGAG
jgi:hypothetical protein